MASKQFERNSRASEPRGGETEPYAEKLQEAARPGQAGADKQAAHHVNASDLFRRYGVLLTRRDGQLDIRVKAGGQDRLLFSVPNNDQGLEQAGKRLQHLVDGKEHDLRKKYGVDFSREGEDIDRQWVQAGDGSFQKGEIIKARPPKLPELYAIEAALAQSQPAFRSGDTQKGLRFDFLKETYVKDEPSTVEAFFVAGDMHGRQAVYFEPGGTDGTLPTEADVEKWGAPQEPSLEAVVVHELAHNSQRRIGWDTDPVVQRDMEKLGFTAAEDPKSHETIWLLKGSDGYLYRCDDEKQEWVRQNSSGQAVDASGNVVVDGKDAARLSNMRMREIAIANPPTDYFKNPYELDAEALMLFRLSIKQRGFLVNHNPSLYRFAKDQDQKDINQTYGVDSHGLPRMIRHPEGRLVANNKDNRQIASEFEARNAGP